MIKKAGAAVLAAMVFTTMVSGCNHVTQKEQPDLSGALFNNVAEDQSISDMKNSGYLTFSLNSMRECCKDNDDNVLISPASLLFALEMTAAGANGNTLDEITDVTMHMLNNDDALGRTIAYQNLIDQTDAVNCANGLFINKDCKGDVYDEYSDFIEDNFYAEINVIDFDDEAADTINDWVDDNTDGLIPEIIDSVDPDDLVYLVNALTFEESWALPYKDDNILENSVFTNSKGLEENITHLYSIEKLYFETDKAVGFQKPYSELYSFIAILPTDDSISANEFLSDFGADDYLEFLQSRDNAIVYSYLPKFTYEYTQDDFKGILQTLGINDAFSLEKADFSNMTDKHIFISTIVQKTFIDLDENGTKAAAATSVCLSSASGSMATGEYEVKLDRPFIYMIVDNISMTPIFIGTVNSVNG